MKVLSLFSGIGAFEKGLRQAGVDIEVVNFCEIDRFASQSYQAVHGVSADKNLKDVTTVKFNRHVDILTHGSPCQDFSVAGKGAGGEEGSGTRSSLLWHSVRIIKEASPSVVMWENVKNVISAKHRETFDAYLSALEELGYNNYYKVLNAKHYGVPQNRERVFCISIRKDLDLLGFEWPIPFDNGVRLKHLLEDVVDEKYYLNREKTAKLVLQLKDGQSVGTNPCITPDRVDKRQNGRRFKDDDADAFTLTGQDRHGVLEVGQASVEGSQAGKIYHTGGLSPTICAGTHGYAAGHIAIKEATQQGYALAQPYDSVNIGMLDSETWRGRVGAGVANTLQTSCDQGVLGENFRIRKLTPLECWRLMGFEDEDFKKAKDSGISDSQLYKQAGNSIVVDVIEQIALSMKHIFDYMEVMG